MDSKHLLENADMPQELDPAAGPHLLPPENQSLTRNRSRFFVSGIWCGSFKRAG